MGSFPDWLLPVIGGVIGAATPGLGRGVALAEQIAGMRNRERYLQAIQQRQQEQDALRRSALINSEYSQATRQQLSQKELGLQERRIRDAEERRNALLQGVQRWISQLPPTDPIGRQAAAIVQSSPETAANLLSQYAAEQLRLRNKQPHAPNLVQALDPNTGRYVWMASTKAAGLPSPLNVSSGYLKTRSKASQDIPGMKTSALLGYQRNAIGALRSLAQQLSNATDDGQINDIRSQMETWQGALAAIRSELDKRMGRKEPGPPSASNYPMMASHNQDEQPVRRIYLDKNGNIRQ